MLGLLAADVDLDANVERSLVGVARRRQPLRDLLAVDRLHPGKAARRGARLVALQGADQMPFDSGQPGQRVDLGLGLLDVVLSEGPLPERVGVLDGLDGKTLAYGQNSNRARVAAGGFGGCNRKASQRCPIE